MAIIKATVHSALTRMMRDTQAYFDNCRNELDRVKQTGCCTSVAKARAEVYALQELYQLACMLEQAFKRGDLPDRPDQSIPAVYGPRTQTKDIINFTLRWSIEFKKTMQRKLIPYRYGSTKN